MRMLGVSRRTVQKRHRAIMERISWFDNIDKYIRIFRTVSENLNILRVRSSGPPGTRPTCSSSPDGLSVVSLWSRGGSHPGWDHHEPQSTVRA